MGTSLTNASTQNQKNIRIMMRFILPSLICIIFCAVTSISPVIGEESKECDANTSAGENTCTAKDDVDHDMKIINEGEKVALVAANGSVGIALDGGFVAHRLSVLF